MMKPRNLATTFAVLGPDQRATPVEVTPGVFEELNRRFNGFKEHSLLSCFSFDADWSAWERHPAGDEIVCLLSGDVVMIIDNNGSEEQVHLTSPGQYVIVPRGAWHTARTSVPTTLLFVTPGEATENRPA